MKRTDWDKASYDYAVINDFSRDECLATIRRMLETELPSRLLDYGAGDGDFAVMCADLPMQEVVCYDPAPNMVTLAAKACSLFPHIRVRGTSTDLLDASFDVITLNAVWMVLANRDECMGVLHDIYRLLSPGGKLIASVTHPCFRMYDFITISTDFDNTNYLKDGAEFGVNLSDGIHGIQVVDFHWSLSAMSEQLKSAGFAIEEILEFPGRLANVVTETGSQWMVVAASKRDQRGL